MVPALQRSEVLPPIRALHKDRHFVQRSKGEFQMDQLRRDATKASVRHCLLRAEGLSLRVKDQPKDFHPLRDARHDKPAFRLLLDLLHRDQVQRTAERSGLVPRLAADNNPIQFNTGHAPYRQTNQ